jgi:hypothetical protein
MKTRLFQLAVVFFVFLAFNVSATVLYVDLNSLSPTPPYADWSTAAATIQDAIFQANSGDTVLVTNGIYQTGGWSIMGSNRICVSVANLTVQSVNGPAVTVIKGYQMPGTTNGASAVRGVFLASGATLSGFTVTGGATVSDNSYAGGIFCASSSAVVTNCVVIGNASASYAGGVYSGTLNNCVLSKNVAAYDGGGCYMSQLNNCLLTTNSANNGGGAAYGNLTNCVLAGNSARSTGGGAYYAGSMDNCTIVGNAAGSGGGGGVYGATLNNCIIYYNTAAGGGITGTNAFNSTLHNCCTLPMPLPGGSGNITNLPGFVNLIGGDFHLQIGSPCVDAGNNIYAPETTDLDGNPRIIGAAVDMGAYENQNTNPVHYVSLSSTNPVAPYTNWITAATNLQDAIAVAQAGEIVAANAGVYTNGGVVIYGAETNRVALTNGITLLGVYGTRSTIIAGGTQTRGVYVGSNSVVSGFTITNGQTRLNGGDTIREQSGGGIWCELGGAVVNCLVISNFAGNGNNFQSGRLGGGIYGGTISNCVLAGNFSGSGGGTASNLLWNCILTNNTANLGGGAYGAVLYNCGLSNNAAIYNGTSGTGGGVYQCTLYNSILMNNQASGSGYGGGAYQGTNFNCLITGNTANYGGGTYQSTNFNCRILGNTASIYGGGAYDGMSYNCVLSGNTATNTTSFYGNGGGLYASAYNSAVIINCTVTGNSATGAGGGIYGGIAFNSIIYFNSAPSGSNWLSGNLIFCCTLPAEGDSSGITNAPLFVNLTNDFHLQSNSPCINSGYNTYVTTTNDLDGNPRIVGGTVDIGAYEFQSPVSQISYAWLQRYGLPINTNTDFSDADGDGMSNYAEWRAGTNPTNAASVLALQSPVLTTTNVTITWQSVILRHYYVQRTTNLATPFSTIATDIIAWGSTTSYTDTTATNSGPYFYRVGVQ